MVLPSGDDWKVEVFDDKKHVFQFDNIQVSFYDDYVCLSTL